MNRTTPLILAVALFMENMDSTVIATSLPAIATDIGTSPIALKLALTAYLVSLAIFIPISAWMADRFGAKLVFRVAIGVFMLGSVACAVSGSLGEFVLARFLQGMGGSMMTPVARLVLVRTTEKSGLVSAMATLTIPALIGPLIGPPVGGFITTFFAWHWIFVINIPIGAIGIWLSGRFLPEIPPEPTRPLDVTGFFLSAIAASGIVFGLSVVSLPALPPVVGVVTIGIGVISALLYVRHARGRDYPLLQLKLFSNPVFRTAIAGGSLFRIGVGATPFLLPLLFQLGFGLTPFQSGMITFATAAGALTMKFVAPRILRTVGFRTVLLVASGCSACLIAANGFFTAETPYVLILSVLFLAGFLRSMFFTSTNALVFADIEPAQSGQATAISAAAQQITVALGVAVGGGALELWSVFTGQAIGGAGFTFAFLVIAVITALPMLLFSRLAPDAGKAISGHGGQRPTVEEPQQL
ncbi:MFS transporter [Aminobacter sp. MDW-2]|uniref:MFS transporter n=1 Tax=Aminobacter sp. MDW-2 TaxID=2666139 RepID=UPI0013126BE0|nr:MFS transporter [Aminobacter sp. MDW-2]MRX34314.1 MFS transporter [Aminobacter sp. MDW-2]QNH33032.1 MFS transporter [Aminobacter sp. MDW-2]